MFALQSCLMTGSTQPSIARSYAPAKLRRRRQMRVPTVFERQPHSRERCRVGQEQSGAVRWNR